MRVGDVAKQLGVSTSAIRVYEREGRIKSTRNPGGHRIFTQDDVNDFLGVKTGRKVVFYVRSSNGDRRLLEGQESELRETHGEPLRVYKDRASGLSDKRPGLWSLIRDAEKGKFNTLVITYKDRLTRFNFVFLEHLLKQSGVEIIILHPDKKFSLEEELLQDFMSIISIFSGKFYRLRSKESQKELLRKANGELDA